MVISFFGHRDCPYSIYPRLVKTVESLVLQNDKITFLIGEEGVFDSLALKAVKEISEMYAYVEYYIVLAYYKEDKPNEPSLYPEEVAMSLPKFSISTRNKWIIEKSDLVITYVMRDWGGAYKSKNRAIKKGKCVVELYEGENKKPI